MNIFVKNFRVLYFITFIFFTSVSFSGCAWIPFWGDEEEEEVELESEFDQFEGEIPPEMEDLKADIESLQSRQEDSQLKLEELEDTVSSLSPGANAESTTNSAEIEELKEIIHKLQSQIGDLKDNMYELEFEAKLRSSQRPRGVSRRTSGGSVKRSYDKALQLFNVGQFDESLRMFKGLDNRRTPNNLRDNVVFWVGQCYYNLEDFDRAIEKFDIVVDEYGNGNKAIDSMYGLGISYNAIGEKSKALGYLEQALRSGPSPGLRRKIESRIRDIEG